MRTQFDQELDKVRHIIHQMGAQASQATDRAVRALLNSDYAEAREVKREDRALDQMRYDVESICVTLMATQQPVARDLRELVATTLVAVELERCGDYAKGVAKAARRISRANTRVGAYNLVDMNTLVRDMLSRSVNAFLIIDDEAAQRVITDDNRVDDQYQQLLTEITHDMREGEIAIESGTWVLHAGHCLERIADRTTNIAERVIFVKTGNLIGDTDEPRLDIHAPPGAIQP